MTNKTIVIALVAVLVIATVGVFTPQGQEKIVERVVERVNDLGALVGPDIYDHLVFHQSFTKGGTQVATTSTTGTYTLTTDELRREVSYISWNPDTNITITTMASSSAPLSLLAEGESYETYFYNASTTAAATVTFAAGTGVDLQEDEGETVVVNGLEMARLTFIKKDDNDVALWVEVGQVGD